ncbi:MAG TPA: EAL domain-containing protein [Burkholderiaceae bacterium]
MAFLTPRSDPVVVVVAILIAGGAAAAWLAGIAVSGVAPLIVATLGLLAPTAIVSVLAVRLRRRNALLAQSLSLADQRLQEVSEQLEKQASIDSLTGLPNRMLLEDRLQHAIRRGERTDSRLAERGLARLALLFIDLDGFKPVNDSLGHAAGDAVLKEVAQRLRTVARDSDTIARVGGDEFALLMEDVGSVADGVSLARRLLQALARPIAIADRQVEISGSIGIVIYPDQGHRDKLIANADAAMYAAKRAGGNTYAVFESHMDAGALDQLGLQHDLRHAIELGQLQLYYQPKVDSRINRIRGVEALLRWNHPERGMVSPALFIPLAERFGLIGSIGRWVIDEACRQIAEWADDGVRMRVAINLSVHQLREEDLVQRIEAAMRRHAIDPSQLLCEITESVAMEDIKATQRAFEGLARIGVYLSIDDFGTGYSSLSYLRQLPARQLKIDRSFVHDLATSSDARAVVDAVVRLAHALGLKVVAEGVETAEQRDILTALSCDELQGYYFARPMPAGALLAWACGDEKPAGATDFSQSILHEAI